MTDLQAASDLGFANASTVRCSLPFHCHFRVTLPPGRRRSFPARRDSSYYAAAGMASQRLAVIPGHPLRWVSLQLLGVPLQLGEVVEGIDAVELAGVNQAHVQVPPLRSLPGLVKQRVLAMQNGLLQGTLDQIVIEGGS